MSFPKEPFVGQRYTAENGQDYVWTAKGGWRSVTVAGTRPKQVPYTASATEPVNPGLGDQWFDTVNKQLKTWANNGSYSFWRTVVTATEFEDPSRITLTAERTLPLVWDYSENNYSFESWSTDPRYSWRDGAAAKVKRIVAQDDTIELDTTSDLIQGKRYVVVSMGGATLAVVDILSVLSATTARARTSFSINVDATAGATLSRTSFDVRAGYALVANGDRLYTRPISVLQDNFKGRLRIRRTAEGSGAFTIGVRTPGTDTFEPVNILETVTPEAGLRDEIYAVEKTGPVEFSVLFTDTKVGAQPERVSLMMLYPAPQAVDQRRVERPTNFAPADQAINVSTTPTLQGSAFRSLYSLPQNGAEFQIAANPQFTNLIVNSSSDFLASWIATTAPGVIHDVVFVDATTLVGVGTAGRVVRSLDAGKTLSPITPAGSITSNLNGVDATNGAVVLVGDAGVIQLSVDGAALTAITPAGGYADVFYGVALAGSYGIVCGAAGEIQRTVNNRAGVYAKAPADNGFTGVFYEVTLLANGRGIAVGSGGEIQTTSDYGATWRKRTQAGGYTGSWFGVHLQADGHAVAVGASGEIQTSDDYGATWTRRAAPAGVTNVLQHVKVFGQYAVAVGNSGVILTSANYGATWSRRTTPGGSTTTLYSLSFTPAGDLCYLVGDNVAYKPLKLEGTVTSYTVPAGENLLEVNKVYYWRVRYQDSAGFWSEFSQPTVFATKATLNSVNAPTNLSPAKDAVNIGSKPTLQASPFTVVGDPDTHTGSQFQLSEGAVFGTVLYDATISSALTSYTFPATLEDQKTYSWRVRYRGQNNDWSQWSTPTPFTVSAKVDKPTLTSATENADGSITLVASAFSSSSSVGTFVSSTWTVSTSPDFADSALVRRTTVSSGDRTTVTLPKSKPDATGADFVPETAYYARVVYTSSSGKVSEPSDSVSLRTREAPKVGEAVWTTPGTYTFTVPDGITSVCAVVVGAGGAGYDGTAGGSSSFGSSVTATGGAVGGSNGTAGALGGQGGLAYGGDGGGHGGNSGAGSYETGGGGAGGYSGNGGTGGSSNSGGSTGGNANSAATGSGGGGGGGGSSSGRGGGGGGVGLFGRGADGVGGIGAKRNANTTSSGRDGGGGSGGEGNANAVGGNGGRCGGGGGGDGARTGGGGGGLTWKNNIAVTPGQKITVTVGKGGESTYNRATNPADKSPTGGDGGVRVIWGPDRSFPNNAA